MKRIILLLASAILGFMACTHFEEPLPEINEPHRETKVINGATDLANPYALKNVQAAVNRITASYGISPVTLQSTHKYVRFFIQDTTHISLLHDSLGLTLFSKPLDKCLTQSEIDHNNYEYDGDEEQWCYAVVPAQFRFPSEVKSEVLDNLYMQKSTGSSPASGSPQLSTSLWQQAIRQSYRNAGISVSDKSLASEELPAVRLGYIEEGSIMRPLEKIKVVVFDGVNYGYAYTDANGEAKDIKPLYTDEWVNQSFEYSILFENGNCQVGWQLKDGKYSIYQYFGPITSSKEWNYVIPYNEPKPSIFAAVHCALDIFFNKQQSITRHLKNMKNKLPVLVRWNDPATDTEQAHTAVYERNKADGNVIEIRGRYKRSLNYLSRRQIMHTMFHELGHASHWQSVIDAKGCDRNINYRNAEKKMKESYANAVEYYITRETFGKDEASKLMIYNDTYTAVGESLLNQGITITALQNTVIYCNKFWKWRDKVVEQCSGARLDDKLVEMIFNNPLTIWRDNFEDMIIGGDIVIAGGKERTVQYTLGQSFQDNGVKVVKWGCKGEGSGATAYDASAGKDTLKVSFPDRGDRQISVTVKFPFILDKTYTYYKDVNVIEDPTVIYNITCTTPCSLSGTVYGGGKYGKKMSCTLRANPAVNRAFEGWYSNGTKVSSQNPYTFTTTQDKAFEAKFTTTNGTYKLNMSVTSTFIMGSNGLYISEPQGTVFPKSGSYTANNYLYLTVTPKYENTATTSYFSHWEDSDTKEVLGTSKTLKIRLTRDMCIKAVFKTSGWGH